MKKGSEPHILPARSLARKAMPATMPKQPSPHAHAPHISPNLRFLYALHAMPHSPASKNAFATVLYQHSLPTPTPRMLQHGPNRDSPLDIAIKHQTHKINALLAHNPRHAQIMVHDLIDAVEGVFLVDDCVEQDTEGPDVLFFAAVGGAGEDFGGGVICEEALAGAEGQQVRRGWRG